MRNIVDSQQTVKQASSQVDSAETVSNVATSLVVPMSKTSKDLAQRDISEGETAQTTKIGAFRYYLSSMGRKTVCGYAAFVLFQTGCSAAQRRFYILTVLTAIHTMISNSHASIMAQTLGC